MNKHTVTGDTREILPAFAKLRAKVFAFDVELGAHFARESARLWKSQGFYGLATACQALAAELATIPGAWDLYVAARGMCAK